MAVLRVDHDEEILLQSSEVERYGDEEISMEELYLTNKNLVCIYKKKKNNFSEFETIVERIPLEQIKVLFGNVQVSQVDSSEYGLVLKVLYQDDKVHYFDFFSSPVKETTKWESEIKKAVIQFASVQEKITASYKINEEIKSSKSTINGVVTCFVCGEKNNINAKFCQNCGSRIDSSNKKEVNNSDNSPEKTVGEEAKNNDHNCSFSQRKQEYAGKIIKCPECGQVLKAFEINCPACGHELRSVKIDSPVNELTKKIEKATSIEEKIELITNFYVPNTREDIYDFFILAVSNLEDTIYDTDDAWRAKLEQTYHKAKLSFGKTPEFEYIEKLYNRTHSKVSKRWFSIFVRKHKWICLSAFLVFIGILFFTICIILLSNGNDNGSILGLLGIVFILSPTMVHVYAEDEKKFKKRKSQTLTKSNIQSIGKDWSEFYHQKYDDVIEQLKILGFKNFEIKPEKKGLLNTDGEIKSISIAGNAYFNADDLFDINSKIIIKYYSKNIKG